MNNEKQQPWSKAELEEWKKFWESEMGQRALEKMRNIKQQLVDTSMTQQDEGAIAAYIGRAAGIEIVLEDIQAGFDALTKITEKEEEEKKTAKK